MSINKNFVVKNGFEVNTDLILANATTKRVGIATTQPRYTLDVAGGIGVTNLYTSGISTFANQFYVRNGSNTTLSALGVGGSVGVGTALPEYLLDIRSPVSTGQTALYVQGDVRVTGDLNLDDINIDQATINNLDVTSNLFVGNNLNVSGISTITSLTGTNISYSGISTFADIRNTNLNCTGVATIANLNATNVTISGAAATNFTVFQNLFVGGIGTITNLNSTTGVITNLSGTDLNYTGISTITNVRSTSLNNTGIGTITNLNSTTGVITNLSGTDLNYTGVSTLGTVRISSGIITATSGIVTYYGDGKYLTNITSGVGLGTTGGIVGYGATILYFQGPGISTITISSGIATINVTGGGGATIGIGTTPGAAGFTTGTVSAGNLWYNSDYGRLFIYYDDGDSAQWVDAAPFNIGIITSLNNVSFSPGSALSPSIYFNNDPSTGLYSSSAGTIDIASGGSNYVSINSSGVNVSGIVTAIDFNSLSDISYKENINTVNDALLKVEQMRGVKFDWKESGLPSYGVIAQELEEVLPELVHGEDPKTVNYNGIIGILIEAIKELKVEIEKLKTINK